jgi:phage terminase small subunit
MLVYTRARLLTLPTRSAQGAGLSARETSVPREKGPRLPPRRQRFVEEYLVDLNAAAAARRAGYTKNRSEVAGNELLTNPDVQAAIQAAIAARSARTEVTQDRVVAELAKVAFGDARKVMTWGPNGLTLKASSELTDEEAAFVAEVSETTTEHGGTLKLKTNDKLKALELLGRHLGMFKEKVEVTGKDGEALAPVIYMPANGRDG